MASEDLTAERTPEQQAKRERHQRYRKTPKGAAACAWNRLTSRAGAKYNHRRCYAHVEVRMTRAEFMTWAVPEYEAWFRDLPDVAPSLDRIRSKGHYELGNLRIIANNLNKKLGSEKRECMQAPPGQKWCPRCRRYLPVEQFNRGAGMARGLSSYCKPCHSSWRAERKRKKAESRGQNRESQRELFD